MLPQRPHGLRSIRRIRAWHRGLDLVVEIYAATRSFPREELFGLTLQLRKGAVAVPSHIAEGTERDSVKDRRRFLTTAKGALAEIETQLEAATLVGYLREATLLNLLKITDDLGGMVTNMRRNIKARPGY